MGAGFATWYNDEHRHSAIQFVTPNEQRHALYEQAKAKTPARWSGATRDWRPTGEMWLNPGKPPPGSRSPPHSKDTKGDNFVDKYRGSAVDTYSRVQFYGGSSLHQI